MAKQELDNEDIKLIYFLADMGLKSQGIQILSSINKMLEKLPEVKVPEDGKPAE